MFSNSMYKAKYPKIKNFLARFPETCISDYVLVFELKPLMTDCMATEIMTTFISVLAYNIKATQVILYKNS